MVRVRSGVPGGPAPLSPTARVNLVARHPTTRPRLLRNRP